MTAGALPINPKDFLLAWARGHISELVLALHGQVI